jgi:hypothetical protein
MGRVECEWKANDFNVFIGIGLAQNPGRVPG